MTNPAQRRRTVSTIVLILLLVLVVATIPLYLILSSVMKTNQEAYLLYYVSDACGDLIQPEKCTISDLEQGREPTPMQLIDALLDGPVSSKLRSPFPSDLRVFSAVLADGILSVNFSAAYAELKPFERRLADCCLTRTVSALDGVYAVSVLLDGKSLPDAEEMTVSDFITDSAFFESHDMTLRLFYPNPDLASFATEHRACTVYGDSSAPELVVRVLTEDIFHHCLEGTSFPDKPFHTVSVSSDIAYVDLSAAFLTFEFFQDEDSSSDTASLYDDSDLSMNEQLGALYLQSMIYSLTELDGITEVVFLFDGRSVDTYAELDLSSPIGRDASIRIQ